VIPPIPPSLTKPCEEFELATTGELTEILQVHASNMGKAHKCSARHRALTGLIESIREEK